LEPITIDSGGNTNRRKGFEVSYSCSRNNKEANMTEAKCAKRKQ
jgi:hypothetical protein